MHACQRRMDVVKKDMRNIDVIQEDVIKRANWKEKTRYDEQPKEEEEDTFNTTDYSLIFVMLIIFKT